MVPTQLHPNGLAQLAGFFGLCQEKGVVLTLGLFSCFFHMRAVDKHACFFTLQKVRGSERLFLDSLLKVE